MSPLAGRTEAPAAGVTSWALLTSGGWPGRGFLMAVQSGVQPPRQPEQPDQRLGIAALCDRLTQLRERPAHELDALVLLALRVRLVQIGRVEEANLLVSDARARGVSEDRLA